MSTSIIFIENILTVKTSGKMVKQSQYLTNTRALNAIKVL
jgi:hypothetical protein